MKTEKPFDCVEYKRLIQEQLYEKYEGLTPEEETQQRTEWLATSSNAAARTWRELLEKKVASGTK